MSYDMKPIPIPTTYSGVNFRSRLEARYAAFFDLAKWEWEYEPLDLNGWIPDFRVNPGLFYRDCDGDHTVLVEVKPYYTIQAFAGTIEYELAMSYTPSAEHAHSSTVALCGNNPAVSYCDLWHGEGVARLPDWVLGWSQKWKRAGNLVQWRRTPEPAGASRAGIGWDDETAVTAKVDWRDRYK